MEFTYKIEYVCYRYRPSPEDQIMKAFQVLDTESKGFLTQEELTKYMTEEGGFEVYFNFIIYHNTNL